MESRSIVFTAPNQVELRQEQVAEPQPHEILCQASASLISIGTEIYCLRGTADPGTNWSEWLRFPFSPGYCMVGRVLAVGNDVGGVRVGDRVASRTSHREIYTLAASDADPIPDGVSDDEASWATLAYVTQIGVRRAQLEIGESVGVIGLGILGQLVAQYLRLAGARRIVAIDPLALRLDAAKAHGATHLIGADVASARDEIAAITDGKMLDVVFDITGNPAVLAPASLLLRRLGRLVLLGDTPTPSQQQLGPRIVADSIAILGIHGTMFPQHASAFNPWTVHEMVALFFDYLIQGRMRVADLITHRHTPTDAPTVYAGLLNDRSSALGILFDWSSA